MVEPIATSELEDAGEPGVTAVLTEEGWQVTDYEEPGRDWRILGDGSFESPDGRTRSFPVDLPNGD